jgi:hypothetical protein
VIFNDTVISYSCYLASNDKGGRWRLVNLRRLGEEVVVDCFRTLRYFSGEMKRTMSLK